MNKSKKLVGNAIPKIEVASGSKSELRLEERLVKMFKQHDGLDRWKFTDVVVIDEGTFSHSHPVLTMGARSRGIKTENGLLSVYLHEQIHWFLSRHPTRLRLAVHDLEAKYPKVKVGSEAGGARDEKSTYLHLLVCNLEFDALCNIIGRKTAIRLVASRPYYPWIYRTVLRDSSKIRRVCIAHDLVP